ncbi:MAG: glycosyltransferase family 4 protein [Bacteroidetes bacterium]|nr:glycosyltransferase family 4 protein [Bacteroidota bacterium]
MKRLGIVVSHPIQYYSPLFRYLAKYIDLVVFYCHNPSEEQIGSNGFGIKFKWDIDLLSGYKYIYLNNISAHPSLNSFSGCDTPDIGRVLKENSISHVVIIGWYLKSYIQALLQSKRSGIKVAVRGDSQLNPDDSIFKHIFKKIFYGFLIRKYDTLMYVGERNKKYLVEYGAQESQLIFSPHAVDQSFWKMDLSEINSKTENKLIFAWAAKFIEKKRPHDAIEAFKSAYDYNKNIELWMIGSGALLESCQLLADNHKAIKFWGFKNQTELKTLLSKSDFILLTSDHRETWGLIVNECFSMGIPAIVSEACGSSADLIEDGKTGYHYKTGDTKQLQERILAAALSDPASYTEGLKRKNEIYSYEWNKKAFMNFMNL